MWVVAFKIAILLTWNLKISNKIIVYSIVYLESYLTRSRVRPNHDNITFEFINNDTYSLATILFYPSYQKISTCRIICINMSTSTNEMIILCCRWVVFYLESIFLGIHRIPFGKTTSIWKLGSEIEYLEKKKNTN